jgi:hypothetical protein
MGKYLTYKFHPPKFMGSTVLKRIPYAKVQEDKLFKQSCQELFALLLCGSLPRIPWLGTVLGIRKDGHHLEFVSDTKEAEYQLLTDVWKSRLLCGDNFKDEVKIKRAIILQLLKICRHLRNSGLGLGGISPETLAFCSKTSGIRLVSLKGAKFIGMEDETHQISTGAGWPSIAKMIVSILSWKNQTEKNFQVPENAEEVLPGLKNLLEAMMCQKIDKSQFINLLEKFESSQPKWNLLTMDGGGARGIVSALVLRELENKLRDVNEKMCPLKNVNYTISFN